MAKRTPNYVLVFVMFAVAGALTHGIRNLPAKALFSADLGSVPHHIGAWTGEDGEISEEVKKGIEADSTLSRLYTRPGSDYYMGALVVYRRYGRRGFVHRPEMCYPAAGWEILSKGTTTVPYAGRETQAVVIVAEREYEKEVVVYWFASGDRLESNYVRQQLRMALDRLTPRKYGWAFVRINAPVVSTEEETLDEIRAFLKQFTKPLDRVLTGEETALATR